MRICMFTNTYLPFVGGVSRSVHSFAEDLRRDGHRVLVVAPSYGNGARRRQDQPEQDPEIQRTPAIQHFNGSDFSLSLPIPFLLSERIREFRPEIVHSHHPYLLGDTALRTARRHQVPLIFTHHTRYESYTHYVPLNSGTLQRFVVSLATRYANLCNHVIAPSDSLGRILRRRGVVTPMATVPTGVDLRLFSGGDGALFRRTRGIRPDAFVLGHVSRLAPEKNLVFLAEAAALALRTIPRGLFLVLGEGPSGAQIREVFRRRRLEDHLMMAGTTVGQDLANAYGAMNLFLFSSFTETQGMVVAEAMAAGVPVVALNAPGVREVVADGRNGRLLPAQTSRKAFADAVLDAAVNLDEIARWRAAALLTAAQFSRARSLQRLLAIYERAVRDYPAQASSAEGDLFEWEALRRRLKVEWDLVAEKVASGMESIRLAKVHGA